MVPISSVSRRSLAQGALLGFTGLAGAAAAPVSANAQLVAMGIEARALGEKHRSGTAEWWKLKNDDPDVCRVGAELDVSHDRLWDLYEQALAIPATTPEELRGKAEIARHFLVVECEDKHGKMEFGSPEQELVWSLICDLTGRA